VANTLRKLRRWPEARAAYEALDALDPASHHRSSAWVNWKAHFPDVLLASGDAAAARKFITRADNAEGTEYESSALHWSASLALHEGLTCGFAAAAQTDAGWPSAFLAGPYNPNQPCDEAVLAGGGAAACVMCKRYPLAVALLVGAAPMPSGRMRAQLAGVLGRVHDTPPASAIWAAGALPVWETVPGALTWLRRMHHTMQLHASLRGEPLLSETRPPAPLDVPAAVALIKRGGVYQNAAFGHDMGNETLVHAATFAQVPAVLRALLAAGGSAVPARARLAPLFRAAYVDAAAPVLKALLAAMPRGHAGKRDAADVAANQGNARALAVILADVASEEEASPDAFRAFLSGTVLLSALASSCEACVRGLGGRCARCAGGAPPHSAHMSFPRCAAVLAGFGAEPTVAALARARAEGRGNPFAGATLAAWQAAWNARSRRQQQQQGGSGSGKKAGGGGEKGAAACCALCGAARAPKKCARCRVARFCDEECLQVGWPLHAPTCTPAADDAAAAGAPA
jgi:hypothetical protein